jgi:hypothetical protein
MDAGAIFLLVVLPLAVLAAAVWGYAALGKRRR